MAKDDIKFLIKRIYVKDISLESPGAPKIFDDKNADILEGAMDEKDWAQPAIVSSYLAVFSNLSLTPMWWPGMLVFLPGIF